MTAYVLLEDGERFDGDAVGAAGHVTGEVVFTTGMSGYQESMTDPSFARQIITFTTAHVGNYGVSAAAYESDRIHAAGAIMREAVNTTVSDEELRIAKEQAIASILLGLESSSARASTLARQEIIHGRRISPDEVIEKIRKTTVEELQEVARTYFKSETIALGVLGNLNGFHVDRSRLEI